MFWGGVREGFSSPLVRFSGHELYKVDLQISCHNKLHGKQIVTNRVVQYLHNLFGFKYMADY